MRYTLLSLPLLTAIVAFTGTLQSALVTGACHVSPVVRDLDRSLHFYRDLLGLEVSPPPEEPVAWDTNPELLDLHGLPDARLRYFGARIPGVRCGIEPVQFDRVDRKAIEPQLQDVGTVTLILLVRDIDTIFSKLQSAGVPVLTIGGQPVEPVPNNKTRGVLVKDPDGHIVELAQLDPPPATTVPESSNVFDIRFRVTVRNLDEAVAYYRENLSISAKAGEFESEKGVLTMMGLPENVSYRYSATPIPGSTLVLEFIEFRGLNPGKPAPHVQDPGAYRLQLIVNDAGRMLDALRKSGSHVISSGGVPVRMTFGRPWLLGAAQDPNGIFLVLEQGPLP